jgi:hypothetical protein
MNRYEQKGVCQYNYWFDPALLSSKYSSGTVTSRLAVLRRDIQCTKCIDVLVSQKQGPYLLLYLSPSSIFKVSTDQSLVKALTIQLIQLEEKFTLE